MGVALQRLARRALLTRLKADASLLALVPVVSIDPYDDPPTWPFVTLESPVTRRMRAASLNGGLVSFDVHAFARARIVAGVTVEDGRDHCSRIGGAIEAALADNRFPIESGAVMHVQLSDMRLLRDGDPDAFHYFAQVNCRVLAA